MSLTEPKMRPEVWAIPPRGFGSGTIQAFLETAKTFADDTGLDLRIFHKGIFDRFHELNTVSFLQGSGFGSLRPASLAERSEKTMIDAARRASNLIFHEYGLPSAILDPDPVHFVREKDAACLPYSVITPDSVFLGGEIRADIWDPYFLDEIRRMAFHSPDNRELEREAARLKPLLKPDNRPLIAIMIGNGSVLDEVQNDLFALPSRYPDARFVLRSTLQVGMASFDRFYRDFYSFLDPRRREELITFDGHRDSPERDFHRASLVLADHMLVVDKGHSLVLQRIGAGKSVYFTHDRSILHASKVVAAMIHSGKVKYFPNDDALVTACFPPLDAPAIAGTLAADYHRMHHRLNQPQEASVAEVLPTGQARIFRSLTQQ